MENEGLASDCLHIIKEQSKRKDIVIFLLIVIIFLNNLAWLVAWNLPIEEIETETYELRDMMEDAPDEKTRRDIERLISSMEQ